MKKSADKTRWQKIRLRVNVCATVMEQTEYFFIHTAPFTFVVL